MVFQELDKIQEREIVPGFRARFIHSDNLTIAYWNIDAGASLPEHAHPHEQVTTITSGRFELVVEGTHRIVERGEVAVIPSNAKHSGKALTDCRITDVFYPVREDYKFVDKT